MPDKKANLLLECTEGPYRIDLGRNVFGIDDESRLPERLVANCGARSQNFNVDKCLQENAANGQLCAHSYDHAMLLWAVANHHAQLSEKGYCWTHVLIDGHSYQYTLDPFGCPILTDALRQALLKLLREEQP